MEGLNVEQNEMLQKKLKSLIEAGKKEGKITSKQLLQTLDALDADEKQTELIYDALENAGIEIDVSDVAEILDAAEDNQIACDTLRSVAGSS